MTWHWAHVLGELACNGNCSPSRSGGSETTHYKGDIFMNVRQLCLFTALVTIATGLCTAVVAKDSRTEFGDGVEVLTRGPVHEAFAETVTYDPEPGIVVTIAPPESIKELPPDQRPDGVNVDWIPGYWAWDDERNDFLWISGVWRALPPGREWVPGYWGRTKQGFQWTSGYWADSQASEIEYLPEPPETLEVGPNLSSPSMDHSWIPGTWVWHQDRYAWRPGYWMTVQSDWDWIPAHYVWAPRGYVFVDGYWDYSVQRRGVLFAPVYVKSSVYARPGFTYSPATVISLSVFSDHLFVRPRYNHYYFGDYYAPSYRNTGFYASFSFNSTRRGYDPIYVQQRWQHRQDPEWGRRVVANFSYRRDHQDARPFRTLAAQVSYLKSNAQRGERNHVLASSVEQYSRAKDSRVRFRRVNDDERQQVAQRGKDMQHFRQERQRAEVDASVDKTPNRSEPIRLKARRSPIAGRRADQLDKSDTPPRRPERPKPDPKVEPKSKKTKQKRNRG
jgi:hypothetical protein